MKLLHKFFNSILICSMQLLRGFNGLKNPYDSLEGSSINKVSYTDGSFRHYHISFPYKPFSQLVVYILSQSSVRVFVIRSP